MSETDLQLAEYKPAGLLSGARYFVPSTIGARTMFRISAPIAFWFLASAGVSAQVAPDVGVAAWGDSLTSGFSVGKAGNYPAMASALFAPPRPVENLGIFAQTSTQIAARMGAVPVAVTLQGDVIPASGSVEVTAISVDLLYDPMSRHHFITGSLCGVPGKLTAGYSPLLRFTRASQGEVVTCASGSPFVVDRDDVTRSGLVWLWAGVNGADPGHTVEGDIAAMVASLGHSRFLVVSVLTSANDDETRLRAIKGLNARLKATYGQRYVDVEEPLLAAATDTPDDTVPVQRGVAPGSLRIDELHLTTQGYAIVAATLVKASLALGF